MPRGRKDGTANIEANNPATFLPNPNRTNSVVRLPSSNREHTVASAWQAIRTMFPVVPWYKVVWFPHNVPKLSFVQWVAVQKGLATMDRLLKWVIVSENKYIFCNGLGETQDHLYFCCDFSAYILTAILRRIFFGRKMLNFDEELGWAAKNCGGKAITTYVYRSALATTVYHVWKERNSRIFRKIALPIHVVLDGLVGDIRPKLSPLRNVKFCASARKMCYNWGISSMIFSH